MADTATARVDERKGRQDRQGRKAVRALRSLFCVAIAIRVLSLTLSAGPEPLPQDIGAAGSVRVRVYSIASGSLTNT